MRTNGFTLLELLISMTLITMVVLVLSLALRSGINSYQKAKDYNKSFFPKTAIEGLLARQLQAIIDQGANTLSQYIFFSGSSTLLSFDTTYSPLGAGIGGIVQVAYGCDEDAGKLFYAQKTITRYNQIEGINNDLFSRSLDSLKEDGWMVETVDGVTTCRFAYRPALLDENVDVDDWPDRFQKGRQLPGEVAIKLSFSKDKKDNDTIPWSIFSVGIL